MASMTQEQYDALDAIATEAAQNFADWYYKQLNDDKKISIASAYTSNNALYKALGQASDIVIGGVRVATPEDYERMLTLQRQTGGPPGAPNAGRPEKVTYEIEALDVQVGNPDYQLAAPPEVLQNERTGGQRLMLLLSVDGVVKFGARAQEEEMKAFHENFVLVPNWDHLAQNRKGQGAAKKYLILSQNFRRRG